MKPSNTWHVIDNQSASLFWARCFCCFFLPHDGYA